MASWMRRNRSEDMPASSGLPVGRSAAASVAARIAIGNREIGWVVCMFFIQINLSYTEEYAETRVDSVYLSSRFAAGGAAPHRGLRAHRRTGRQAFRLRGPLRAHRRQSVFRGGSQSARQQDHRRYRQGAAERGRAGPVLGGFLLSEAARSPPWKPCGAIRGIEPWRQGHAELFRRRLPDGARLHSGVAWRGNTPATPPPHDAPIRAGGG